MRARLIAVSLLAGIVVPAGSALASTHSQGGPHGIGIRLVDVPADSLGDPRARSYIVDRVAPGTMIRRRVEITNTTDATAAVAVYAAAAGLHRGRFAFASGRTRNELSSWTSMSRRVLVLSAGSKGFATVTIIVPRDASSGERYAVIWAQVSGPVPAGGGVTLVNRVGVRMYLSVGPGGGAASNFAVGALTAKRSAGDRVVVARVRNNGGRTLDITGKLTLSKGPGGLSAGPFPVKLGMALAPGHSEGATVRLDKRLPRGPWRAQMRLSSGLLQRVAVATITFPRLAAIAKPPLAKPVPAGSKHRVLVWALALLALLAVAAAAVLFLRAPRGRGGLKSVGVV